MCYLFMVFKRFGQLQESLLCLLFYFREGKCRRSERETRMRPRLPNQYTHHKAKFICIDSNALFVIFFRSRFNVFTYLALSVQSWEEKKNRVEEIKRQHNKINFQFSRLISVRRAGVTQQCNLNKECMCVDDKNVSLCAFM